MVWAYLAGAIAFEVFGTLSLRAASAGRRAWYVGVVGGYLVAFTLLALTLREGLGIGVAYGIWAACGVAVIAVAGRVLFREPLTPVMGVGIGLIVAGVLLIELGRVPGGQLEAVPATAASDDAAMVVRRAVTVGRPGTEENPNRTGGTVGSRPPAGSPAQAASTSATRY